MEVTITRREILTLGLPILAGGCLDIEGDGEDNDGEQIGTLEVEGLILEEEPVQATILNHTDERIATVELFRGFLAYLTMRTLVALELEEEKNTNQLLYTLQQIRPKLMKL